MLIIAGIGWAKPVEINTRNLRNPKTDMLWISLAGPTANLVLAVAFAMLVRLAIPWNTGEYSWQIGRHYVVFGRAPECIARRLQFDPHPSP